MAAPDRNNGAFLEVGTKAGYLAEAIEDTSM
jgi:hypothetical protein